MLMWFKLIMLPVVGALIGWGTNVVAIKLIFRPLQPVKIPFTQYTIQGLIPKRRAELAKSIAQTIEEKLVSIEELVYKVTDPAIKRELKREIIKVIQHKLQEKIPSLVPQPLRSMVIGFVVETVNHEIDRTLDDLMDKLIPQVGKRINLGEMVEEKINNFELLELEQIVLGIASRELKAIEIIGGVLGFLIGLVQAGMMMVLQ